MDPVEQALFWPEAMLRAMGEQAHRLDRSLSWCAQRAWSLARAELKTLAPVGLHPRAEAVYQERYFAPNPDGRADKRRQTLFFPPAMLEELKAEAERQDRSLSWLLQRAWCLAVHDLEALPSP